MLPWKSILQCQNFPIVIFKQETTFSPTISIGNNYENTIFYTVGHYFMVVVVTEYFCACDFCLNKSINVVSSYFAYK